MLELPKAGEPFAQQINTAIQDALNAGKSELVLSEGSAGIEEPIVWPIEPFSLIGSGTADDSSGTRLGRVADCPIVQIIGENRGNDLSGMIRRPRFANVLLDGRGFSQPLLVMENVYEAQLDRIDTRGWFVQHIRISNVWDSRFANGTCVGGGMCDPAGGLKTELEQRLGFPIGTPMVEIVSPNLSGGNDTANNLYWYGWRFESQPNNAIFTLLHGNNGVMHNFTSCKWEGFEGCSPLVVAVDQSALHFSDCWAMGGGSGSAQYAIGSTPAGTKFAEFPHPGVLLCRDCRSVSGGVTMAYHDGTPGEHVAALDALACFEGCDAPFLSVYVIQGLTGLDADGAIVKHIGTTGSHAFHVEAQPYAWALCGEKRPPAVAADAGV